MERISLKKGSNVLFESRSKFSAHLKNMPLRHKSKPGTNILPPFPFSVSSNSSSFARIRDPLLPSINVPSSYRFFNRAAYCRRCIPSDRGIVRVSRERSRLIRHRKTRSFPPFSDFTLFPSRREESLEFEHLVAVDRAECGLNRIERRLKSKSSSRNKEIGNK